MRFVARALVVVLFAVIVMRLKKRKESGDDT
jgi:hypothetical protein